MNVDYPFVSIIMPIFNEANFIEKSLGSVFQQDYPVERMEVIVVDGMSQDDTRSLVKDLFALNPSCQNFLLDNVHQIVPPALNIGLRQAKGEIIVRMDGHTILARDYVSQSVETMLRTGAACVGGVMRPVGYGWNGRAIALAHGLRFGLGGGAFHSLNSNQDVEVDTVYMGVFNRSIFQQIGYFDEDLVRNQDIELNGRIINVGKRIILSPHIQSTYFCRNSLKKLWEQNFKNGLWLIPTITKTPLALSYRHFVPLCFIATLLIGLLGWLAYPLSGILFLGVLGSYAICSISASAFAASRHGWEFLMTLPIVFPILHFSYGIGSLFGLVKSIASKVGKTPITQT